LLHQIFIVVTNKCCARCKLCGYWKTGPGEEKFLSPGFIKDKVVPFINDHGIENVCITGGEPTLHPGLPEIVKEIKKAGPMISVVTNGSHPGEIFEKVMYDVHGWLFSLDAGNKSLHARIRGLTNFDEITAWPEKIKRGNPAAQIAFNCLIQKWNVRDLVNVYDLICKLPCEGIFFNVPELKPYCFVKTDPIDKSFAGSTGQVPRFSKKPLAAGGQLDNEEMEILKTSLEKIVETDRTEGRYKLMQSDSYFKKVIDYFEYLRGGEVKFEDRRCHVPFMSLVVDESERVLPCFYLPPDMAYCSKGKELIDNGYFKNIEERLADPQFRASVCTHCLQLQS